MTSVPTELQEALGDRYAIEGVVGEGGMATVYRAHDLRHHRQVAVKVLRAELAQSLGADRFLKEIEIAARLSHPNIVPLYDSGAAEGLLYYVMPLVQGESLRAVFRREGTLTLAATLDVTSQVGAALGYAHEQGVLHRDIKPENILLSGAHAFVVDFGIGKALDQAAGKTLTRTGFALGTPGYMSPEQAAGVRTIDARTDVYGLACVVYEALVGETPGLWLTETAARVGRFVDATSEHRSRLDELPARVEQALARALAMRPDDRFPTPSAFLEALREGARSTGARYGSEEIRAIIGRAARIEAERVTEANLMSIGGVERLAAEVGIAPEDVRRALRELGVSGADAEPRRQVAAFPATAPRALPPVQGANSVHVERVVDAGVEIDDVGSLVAIVGETLGPGEATEWEGTVTWTPRALPGTATRHLRVSITPGGGETRITIDELVEQVAGQLFGGVAGAIFGGLFGLTIGGAVSAGEPSAFALFGFLGTIGGAFTVARSLGVNAVIQRERQLEALAGRLAGKVRQIEGAKRAALRPG